jgi:hypothetical protein
MPWMVYSYTRPAPRLKDMSSMKLYGLKTWNERGFDGEIIVFLACLLFCNTFMRGVERSFGNGQFAPTGIKGREEGYTLHGPSGGIHHQARESERTGMEGTGTGRGLEWRGLEPRDD